MDFLIPIRSIFEDVNFELIDSLRIKILSNLKETIEIVKINNDNDIDVIVNTYRLRNKLTIEIVEKSTRTDFRADFKVIK